MSGYMSKLSGLLLYVINIYFSNGVQGSSATLTCSISSNNYVWYKYQKSPEKWIQLTNDGKYANINKKQMTIENVSVADSTEYLCVGDGQPDKTLLNVAVVSRRETSIQLTWLFEITNYLWQRFTQNVWSTLLTNDGKYANVNTLQLTIYNVDAYDSGQYRCTNLVLAERITSIHLHVIVNGGWSDWSDWTCSVTCGDGAYTRHRSCINPAPANGGSNCFGLSYETGSSCNIGPCEAIPSIEISQPSYNGGIGGNITLECQIVNSYPSVQNLWWTHDNLTIQNSGRYSGSTISNPLLTITGVIASDSGYYYCFASNAIGLSHALTKLSTGNLPKVEIVNDRYVLTKGTNVTIECNVKYGDKITWFKDNAILQQNNTYYLGNLNRSYLVINDVKPTDRGVYKCYVTNNYGSQSDETSLKVVQTEILNSSYVMTANESVSLNCAIYDATEVKWRKDDVNILIDSGRYSGGNTTVPSLTITKLNRGDSGMYHCESLYDSMSSMGNGIMLRIRDKPLVKSPEENVIAIIGKDTIIECSFDSYPKPTGVSWMKDSNILNGKDGAKYNGSTAQIPSLTIYNVDYSDSGTYVCLVENLIGRSSGKSIKLNVQVAEPLKSVSNLGPVAGGVSSCIVAVVLVILAVYIYTKRKRTNTTQSNNYETRDCTKVELHLYDETQRHSNSTNTLSPVYVNTSIGLTSSQSDMNTTLTLYDARDFMLILQDKSSLSKHIRKEYEVLKSWPVLRAARDNDIVDVKTGATIAEEYISKALIKTLDERNGYIIRTVPDQSDIDNFWTMIINSHIGCIVLVLQEVEKISEFFPKTIEPINTYTFKVEICSFDKLQNNIFVFVLNISNKVTNTVVQVKLYRTTDWKAGEIHPSIDTMCKLLNVISSKVPGIVALMGSKLIGVPVCGNLGACHEVLHAINNEKGFNILQISVGLKHIRPALFHTFEEYNLCYKVIDHFLQNEHTYAVID